MTPNQPRRPWQPSPGPPAYPGALSPDAPLHAAASLRVLAAGSLGERPASTVTLVRDGAALIVVNPGAVADVESILRPLRELGIAPAAVTDVVLARPRPGHTVNAALFPAARLHGTGSGGSVLSPSVRLIETPGPLAAAPAAHSRRAVERLIRVISQAHRRPPGPPAAYPAAVSPARAANGPRPSSYTGYEVPRAWPTSALPARSAARPAQSAQRSAGTPPPATRQRSPGTSSRRARRQSDARDQAVIPRE